MSTADETRNCPFCLNPVLADEEQIRCPRCGVLHHADCWKTNGRCSVYGCDGWAAWTEAIARRIAPPAEDAVIVEKAEAAGQPEVYRCIKCGAEVGPRQVVCWECRKNERRYWFENCTGPAALMLGILALIVRAVLS